MGASDGAIGSTTKIVDHGSPSSRWDLVVLGDGYRAIRAGHVPHRCATPSLLGSVARRRSTWTSGRDQRAPRRRHLDRQRRRRPDRLRGNRREPEHLLRRDVLQRGTGGVRLDRLLTVDTALALSTATAAVARCCTRSSCVVNSAKYGGAGGAVAVTSTHPSASEIAIDELGHSAFGLADEYGGNGTGTPTGERRGAQRHPGRRAGPPTSGALLVAATTPMPSRCNAGCPGCVPPASPPPPGAVGTYEGGIYSDCGDLPALCRTATCGPSVPRSARCARRVIRQVLQPFLPARVDQSSSTPTYRVWKRPHRASAAQASRHLGRWCSRATRCRLTHEAGSRAGRPWRIRQRRPRRLHNTLAGCNFLRTFELRAPVDLVHLRRPPAPCANRLGNRPLRPNGTELGDPDHRRHRSPGRGRRSRSSSTARGQNDRKTPGDSYAQG